VGGLRTAIQDGVSGVLVDGHDPAAYARVLRDLVADPDLRERLSRGAVAHASRFGWNGTVDRLMAVYAGAISSAEAANRFTRALPS
jgi:D-inositol-3-phosphate glycosyltransferase